MADAKIIDGKAFAANLRQKIAGEVARLNSLQEFSPGLAVVLVGSDPASEIYVRNKVRQTTEAGMRSFEHRLAENTGEAELIALVKDLNENPAVNGILVQLPLPSHINVDAVLDTIDPAKDVDGFHVINSGRLFSGSGTAMVPCTPVGCLMMIKDAVGDLTGKRALVLGRSNIVGKPMAQLLLREHCTVTMAHSRTVDLAGECRRADILVAAVGQAKMVKGDWIKPGATVIDVGMNRYQAEDGKSKLCGDVDFAEALKVAGAVTPVPGGVGPMTIACLLRNTLVAACAQEGLDPPDLG
jgi:methylenetetrahydrofolate dehydrogenase (NADP+) / methenyltetrahydrofolate cyclohydrolase